MGEQLATGLPAEDREVTRQVADSPTQGRTAGPGRHAEQRRPTARRPDQVEEDADRGGLTGPVGTQEAVHLARANLEIEAGEPAPTAI
jgi:hypothetical protein